MPALEHEVSDATQRVNVNAAGQPVSPPPRRTPAQRPNPSHRSAAAAARKRRERNTIIAISASAGAIVLILLIVLMFSLFKSPADDGKILSNVFAAGVNLGGMTKEQANNALHNATDKTYSLLEMSVTVLDTEIRLSPADTGASLDVEAVVDAAYNFGRTGTRAEQQQAKKQAQSSSYTVSILPYLNLKTAYIQQQVAALGEKYSTTRSNTTFRVEGAAPTIAPGKQDVNIAQQTLIIRKGTAEYGMNTSALYQQIMDAYNINIFEVTGSCTEIPPDAPDYETLYAEHMLYVAPINAARDENLEIIVETYGYGITQEALKSFVDQMPYGAEETLPLYYITPDYTSENLDVMFTDILGSFESPLSADANWNHNMQQVCNILNGIIIKDNEEFSFNTLVGETTMLKGYLPAYAYVGKQYAEVYGGGICQVATGIYYSSLLADLQITERHSHSYVTSFVAPGFDAEVYYLPSNSDATAPTEANGSMDLRFLNTTGNPIRVEASISGGKLIVRLMGIDDKDYTVQLSTKTDKLKSPITVYNLMYANNPGGYVDGDVLVEGIAGCDVSTYIIRTPKETGRPNPEELITNSYYAKLDTVVVQIQTDTPVDPTNPTDPTDPTEPSEPVPEE